MSFSNDHKTQINRTTARYQYSILTPCLCNTKYLTLPSHIFNKKKKYILNRHIEYRYYGDYEKGEIERIEENIHCIKCKAYDFFYKIKS